MGTVKCRRVTQKSWSWKSPSELIFVSFFFLIFFYVVSHFGDSAQKNLVSFDSTIVCSRWRQRHSAGPGPGALLFHLPASLPSIPLALHRSLWSLPPHSEWCSQLLKAISIYIYLTCSDFILFFFFSSPPSSYVCFSSRALGRAAPIWFKDTNVIRVSSIVTASPSNSPPRLPQSRSSSTAGCVLSIVWPRSPQRSRSLWKQTYMLDYRE
jgi:hypothetical protein